jgi:hypothetical protein
MKRKTKNNPPRKTVRARKPKRKFVQRRIRKVNTHRVKKKLYGKKNDYKISFLKKEKDIADKWSDIIAKHKPESYVNGEFSERRFFNIIKKTYGISRRVHNLYLNNVADKADIKNINERHKLRGYSNIREVSPRIFTKHDFTFDNFFKAPAGWRRLQYHWRHDRITKTKSKFFEEQFYFRCGLRMVFASKTSGTYIDYKGKYTRVYIADPVPVSTYSFEPFSKGWFEFFNEIKDRVHGYDSLLFFQFLYLDVTIL